MAMARSPSMSRRYRSVDPWERMSQTGGGDYSAQARHPLLGFNVQMSEASGAGVGCRRQRTSNDASSIPGLWRDDPDGDRPYRASCGTDGLSGVDVLDSMTSEQKPGAKASTSTDRSDQLRRGLTAIQRGGSTRLSFPFGEAAATLCATACHSSSSERAPGSRRSIAPSRQGEQRPRAFSRTASLTFG